MTYKQHGLEIARENKIIHDDNTGVFHLFECDLSKCEINLCDLKIYIDQFLDFFFWKYYSVSPSLKSSVELVECPVYAV